MAKALYIEATSGIAGDMMVGALLDLGLPELVLRDALSRLPIQGYEIEISNVYKHSLQATKFDVRLTEPQPGHRHWRDIQEIYRCADLDTSIRQRALSMFLALAKAEAQAHQCSIEEVHFHEVGAVDCILDITATALGLAYFDIDLVTSSTVAVGSGQVNTAHGLLPVPTPATMNLLVGAPTQVGVEGYELTTPTGAAILATFAQAYEEKATDYVVERVGYGAGTYDLQQPNVLTLYLGQRLCRPQWKVEAPYIFGTSKRIPLDEW